MGGRVEQYSSWKTWITEAGVGDFTNSMLVRNAQIDFTKTTGITGPTSTHDEGYNKDTVVVEPMHCKGGDPTVSCQANFQQWGKTVDTSSPILLDYDLAPISDLVTDPNVKLALEAAIKDYYLEQQLVWENLNKCPPSCFNQGKCDSKLDAIECTCPYNGIVGRMCSGCAPVMVRATFTDIDGHKESNTASVPCSSSNTNNMNDKRALNRTQASNHNVARKLLTARLHSSNTVVYTGTGKCTGAKTINRYVGTDMLQCEGGVTVQCSRNEVGNLVAEVTQAQCYEKLTCQTGRGRGCPPRNKKWPAGTFACGGFKAASKSPSKVVVDVNSATAKAQMKKGKSIWEIQDPPSCAVNGKAKKPCKVSGLCEFV